MRAKMVVLVVAALLLAAVAASGARAGVVTTIAVPLGANEYYEETEVGEDVGHLVSGPVLAGGGIAWAQGTGDDGAEVRTLVPGRGGPATVATLPVAPTPTALARRTLTHTLQLVGSPTRLAWSEDQRSLLSAKYVVVQQFQARLQAGPVGGPFTTVAGCDRDDDGVICDDARCFADPVLAPSPPATLDGDVLVSGELCWAGGGDRVVDGLTLRMLNVRPSSLGAGEPFPALRALTASLELLHSVHDDDVPVYVVRVADGSPFAAYPALPGERTRGRHAMALQADGKVAALLQPPYRCGKDGACRSVTSRTAVWAAPGDTAFHALPLRATPDDVDALRFAGDHIMYEHHGADEDDLVVADLAGHTRTLVRLPHVSGRLRLAAHLNAADFDGTTATWAVTRCEHAHLGVSGPDDAPVTFAPAVCDTPRILSDRAHADRHGRVPVRVTCAKACHGTLSFTAADHRATVRFALPGARRLQTVLLPLGPALRRALARHPLDGDVEVEGQRAAGASELKVT